MATEAQAGGVTNGSLKKEEGLPVQVEPLGQLRGTGGDELNSEDRKGLHVSGDVAENGVEALGEKGEPIPKSSTTPIKLKEVTPDDAEQNASDALPDVHQSLSDEEADAEFGDEARDVEGVKAHDDDGDDNDDYVNEGEDDGDDSQPPPKRRK